MKLNMIDLFSGCGGLTEGFMQTGRYKTLAAVDWELPTVNTLRKRLLSKWKYTQVDKKVFYFDMQRTDELIYGWKGDKTYQDGDGLKSLVGSNEVDIVVGGPPCQAYSIAGRIRDKNGMRNDYRNYLFESYIKVVESFEPGICIFENVQGMLSASPGGVPIIKRVTEAFSKAGYYITTDLKKTALLDTADFGIPQRRLRVIIIAINKNKFKDYRSMVDNFYKKMNSFRVSTIMTVEDSIGDLPKIFPLCNPEKRVSHYIESDSKGFGNHTPRFHNSRDVEIFKLLANDIQSGQYKYIHSDDLKALYTKMTGKNSSIHKYHVLRRDKPSNTIPAHLYKDGLRHIHPDPLQARSITVREAARLQTFDDDYDFTGGNGAKYKMIGNAVPPKFARHIANSIQYILK